MKKIQSLICTLALCLLIGITSIASANDFDEEFSQAQLEQILAPIALYPDSVLTHILIASTYPLEVVQANRWAEQNSDLSPADAMEAVEDQSWDPSIKALIPFPNVLSRMSDDLEWTQQLGDAFLQDEQRTLDAIQALRQRADEVGNLDKMENVKVVREKRIIVIEPLEPDIVYVPYYDTRIVYGDWYWVHYPPVYWRHSHYHHHHHGPFYWHPRVRISFDFFFGGFHWHDRHIIVSHYHHTHRGHYRYYRRNIVNHVSSARWQHNPRHRRGVAYRSNTIRERYNDVRPSRAQTRQIRQAELSQRNNDRRNSVTARNRNEITTRNLSDRGNRQPNVRLRENNTVVEPDRYNTRQSRLRNSLNERRSQSNVRRELSTSTSDDRQMRHGDIKSPRANNREPTRREFDRQTNRQQTSRHEQRDNATSQNRNLNRNRDQNRRSQDVIRPEPTRSESHRPEPKRFEPRQAPVQQENRRVERQRSERTSQRERRGPTRASLSPSNFNSESKNRQGERRSRNKD